MATAPSPLAGTMARQMVAKIASMAGQQGGAPSGAGGGGLIGSDQGPDSLGAQVSSQLAELNGADPKVMVRTMVQMKGIIVQMFTRSAFQMPGVARNLSQAMKFLDGAIKEAQQAASTVDAVQAQIGNNAAISMPGMMSGGGDDSSTPGGM